MATYNEIKGDTIEVRATDPANPVEGEIWYNSTTGVIKGYGLTAAAWASASSASTAREARSAEGTQTATVLFGGADSTASPYSLNNTEEYNGSVWTAGGSLNTARLGIMSFGAGIPSSVAAAGATDAGPATPHRTTATEEYNGSSWTTVTGCSTARFAGGGFGIESAGAIC